MLALKEQKKKKYSNAAAATATLFAVKI